MTNTPRETTLEAACTEAARVLMQALGEQPLPIPDGTRIVVMGDKFDSPPGKDMLEGKILVDHERYERMTKLIDRIFEICSLDKEPESLVGRIMVQIQMYKGFCTKE